MAKRNIAYFKPEDPKFLRLLKEQVGYSDSNPKFDKLENVSDDFADDDDNERPQIVVLKPGDLTMEEAAAEEHRIQKEEEKTKADLTQRIIFTSRKSKSKVADRKRNLEIDKPSSKKFKQTSRPVLSFDDNEDD